MGKRVIVADDADGRRGARFGGDEDGFVGQETVAPAAEELEGCLQTACHERRHPEVER